jgi:hypothetical protein
VSLLEKRDPEPRFGHPWWFNVKREPSLARGGPKGLFGNCADSPQNRGEKLQTETIELLLFE